MLVMYTLHQSILSQLPKTSYMKMIDIWLLYGLTIPFLVFILEVSSQMLRHRKQIRRGRTNQMAVNMQHIVRATIFRPERVYDIELERENGKKDLEENHEKDDGVGKVVEFDDYTFLEKLVLRYKRVTIPLMTTVFILGYAIVAVAHYSIN